MPVVPVSYTSVSWEGLQRLFKQCDKPSLTAYLDQHGIPLSDPGAFPCALRLLLPHSPNQDGEHTFFSFLIITHQPYKFVKTFTYFTFSEILDHDGMSALLVSGSLNTWERFIKDAQRLDIFTKEAKEIDSLFKGSAILKWRNIRGN